MGERVFVSICEMCAREQERKKHETVHRTKDGKAYLNTLVDC